ncbi:MAG: 4-hydroxybenzoyl-CoA thioesterase family active site [uncultured Sulfurovum sp.]|uniref:4-hydroxybenzoyl-CoA thioesterase family active site n=1 Tax=uncultured Sulfurovum sp. TaxID=269237 RepID=A0A6S6T9A4_9BACT|nr:MAG: 4-hydroxybenzoyl-CoA thioesterase family active site [uncultured Sulfurovum sp.]
MQIRIFYEDTDAGGIVYHTNYIKYCERARSELFFSKNLQPMDGDNSGFVVRHIDANFLGTSKLGDMIEVSTVLLTKKKASLTLQQTIKHRDNNKKIFQMNITLVFIRHGKPSAIPEMFSEVLNTE